MNNNGTYVNNTTGANNNSSSTSLKFKKFLKNKNTVTFFCVVAIVAVLVIGYNWRVNSQVEPVLVPYAKVTIQPKQKITQDMIGYRKVARASLEGEQNPIFDVTDLVNNKYANYNTIIPKGSLFYEEAVANKSELPDYAVMDIPDGYTLYYLTVTMKTSYMNSMMPESFIDLYVSAKDDKTSTAIVGKLYENIQLIAVKTADGKDVFENSEETRVPNVLIFAVPTEYYITLKQLEAINTYGLAPQKMEITPVPSNKNYVDNETDEKIEPTLTSEDLVSYIKARSKEIDVNRVPTQGESD